MNADDIAELAKELETTNQPQAAEDKRAKEAVLQMGLIDAQNKEVKPVGAGHDAVVYKQKFSYLSAIPYLRINAPKPELADAAENLENALEGIWLLSQGAVDVWRKMVASAVWSGRGWSKVTCWPAAWGEDFRQGDEDDEDYNARLALLKAENFPIIWRAVDSENTWPTFNIRGELDEVVGIREMTARAARKAYGDILQGKYGEREKVKVIEYDDDEDCVTILLDRVMSSTQSREVKRWPHGMGVNPNVFIELEPVPPENDRGIRWAGCSFDGRHARPVIDSILSDALFNFRKATRAPDEYYLDKDSESATPGDAASARKITNAPDAENFFWASERHERPQPNQTNEDGWRILTHLLALSRDMDISDVLKGALKGDETGILYNTAGQLAQKQFDPTIENFKRGAREIGKRFFRSVKSFAREFEGIKDAPNGIPIVFTAASGESFSLELKPKQVEGWETRIQPRLELAIPVNENAQLTVARLATSPDNQLMDVAQAQSRYLGIENTQDTNRKILRDQFRRAMVAKAIDVVTEQGLQLMTGQPGDLSSLVGTFDPAEQEALRRLAQQQGVQIPGMPPDMAGLARAEAGRNRTGMQQQSTGARGNSGQAY